MINKDNLSLANQIQIFKLQINHKLMFKGFEEHIEGKEISSFTISQNKK